MVPFKKRTAFFSFLSKYSSLAELSTSHRRFQFRLTLPFFLPQPCNTAGEEGSWALITTKTAKSPCFFWPGWPGESARFVLWSRATPLESQQTISDPHKRTAIIARGSLCPEAPSPGPTLLFGVEVAKWSTASDLSSLPSWFA